MGDTIKVEYNDRTYLIDVLEVKPENSNNAITIVEADVQVDFAPPLDYVEPTYQPVNQPATTTADTAVSAEQQEDQAEEEDGFVAFQGQYHTLSGRPPKQLPKSPSSAAKTKSAATPKPAAPPPEVVFQTRSLTPKKSEEAVGAKRKRRRRGEPVQEQEPDELEPRKIVPFSG